MDEEGGAPTKLVGISDINPDEEILRLEGMARDGIRPPIVGLQTAAVTLANGNTAIVMRIHKSWNPPHQVTTKRPFDSMDEARMGSIRSMLMSFGQFFCFRPVSPRG